MDKAAQCHDGLRQFVKAMSWSVTNMEGRSGRKPAMVALTLPEVCPERTTKLSGNHDKEAPSKLTCYGV